MFIKDYQYQHIMNPAIGGKARNLLKLGQLNLPVPKWIVLPADYLAEVFKDVASIENANDLLGAIDAYRFPSFSSTQIETTFPDTAYFAVRSSAIDEDGRQHSFAGQFDSYLYVRKEDIFARIKDVWRSLFSERVLSYRAANSLGVGLGIGVIVQEMIDADASGVAFGMNPLSGNRKEKLISGVFGVGEGLVSGDLDADNFTILKGRIDRQVVRKKEKFILNPAGIGGAMKIDIPRVNQNDQSIPDVYLYELDSVLDRLRAEYNLFQDVEFAIKEETLYILQARPITSLHKVPDISGDYVLWDNSNIIESYPGVTTPLTFSFISQSYEGAYKLFCSFLGVSEDSIRRNERVFANTLGLINGRVYYNLKSWYHMLAMLPGYSLNARFMEKMMGVKEQFDVPKSYQLSAGEAWRSMLWMLLQMYRRYKKLPQKRTAFKILLDATIAKYKQIDFQRKNANELMQLYLHFERKLLNQWKAPLLNDFFAMIWFGLLQKRTEDYTDGQYPNIHNDLLCGSADIISTQPIHRSIAIATFVQEVDYLRAIFEAEDPEDIWRIVQHDKREGSEKLLTQIRQYLADFGERCVGELKLETISYSQDPTKFVQIIKSYVEAGITTAKTNNTVEEELRRNAEEKMKGVLRRKPFKKWLFKKTLKKTRELVSARENLRYERTRAFGIVRELFTHMGRRFYEEDILEFERDIFYLTKDEIFAYIEGRSVNQDLKSLVAVRKDEFELFRRMEAPSERIATYGAVYQSNDFFSDSKTELIEGDLKGIGCCPGRVTAKVRIVLNPSETKTLNGDILVTSSTDPGWVTLFPSAAGILVERGSLLSHSAIVSREMGIPCVVGITGLLKTLKTGDWIEMDGSTGEIKILDPQE
ncbi:phosphoenolpyruvate synthase [Sphingobacterium alkalisoli]|uniref:Phosphoenolpyruvate synthase n=1 Tax=Sphingobacterium alkalisoli TaxID=1874115 RepID=A0A4U0H466_9SPHI|nr:PEP/pyruvate-binding domain-containing protein [Sphingobacterium alkalisoli]TJY66450.1 phosphoenolpyruvate synthase [Sphingobacterium alkalisoli]GGH16334.1 phosphoenolpyruvate synthase [Sphingobacterium alkalisoli]